MSTKKHKVCTEEVRAIKENEDETKKCLSHDYQKSLGPTVFKSGVLSSLFFTTITSQWRSQKRDIGKPLIDTYFIETSSALKQHVSLM